MEQENEITPNTENTKKQRKRYSTWSQKSYGEKIQLASVILSASKEDLTRLSKRGINKNFLDQIEEHIKTINEINNRQAFLKGELRKTTAKLETKIKSLGERVMKLKKLIKAEIPQPEWKKFGFNDTQ